MRASRRPGGVPDQLETEAIAGAVAERLWTLDGQPWPEVVVGGSCGPAQCTLEVAGTPPGALGEDLYVFSVDLASGSVELVDASLRGLPAGLALQLDEVARGIASNELLYMELASVRWLPPPDEGSFILAYRTGGEEGSCGLDANLDATTGIIWDLARRNC